MSSQSVFAVDSEPEQKPQIEVSDYESVDFDVSTFEIAKEFESPQIVNDVGKQFERNFIFTNYNLFQVENQISLNDISRQIDNKPIYNLKKYTATNDNIRLDIPFEVGW